MVVDVDGPRRVPRDYSRKGLEGRKGSKSLSLSTNQHESTYQDSS